MHTSLYLKYRFSKWSEIAGQEHISRTLRSAIRTGRIAHAYLFAGPRGTGKTSMARLFGLVLNCENPRELDPCGVCRVCEEFKRGSFLDIIEIDAASNRGIDEIRQLREKVYYSPTIGKYSIYIIDEAHMLTKEACNAFLKTLEEPPSHAIFILATTEPSKILPTIHSRCQRYDFRRISMVDIVNRLRDVIKAEEKELKQKIDIPPTVLATIARAAKGGMRDALSILEQILAVGAFEPGSVDELLGLVSFSQICEFLDAISRADIPASLSTVRELFDRGRDPANFVEEVISSVRNMMLIQTGIRDENLLDIPEDMIKELDSRARNMDYRTLFRLINIFMECLLEIKSGRDQRISIEMSVLRFVNEKSSSIDTLALEERLSRLENALNGKIIFDGHPHEIKKAGLIAASQSLEKVPEKPKVENRVAASSDKSSEETSPAQKSGVQLRPPSTPDKTHDRTPEKRKESESSGELNLELIKEMWPVFLGKVQKKRMRTHALISEGRPVAFEKGRLTIHYDQAYSFHAQNVQEESSMKIILDSLQETFGMPIRVSIELMGKNVTRPVSKQEQMEEVIKDPFVQKALEILGGKIIEIKDKEK